MFAGSDAATGLGKAVATGVAVVVRQRRAIPSNRDEAPRRVLAPQTASICPGQAVFALGDWQSGSTTAKQQGNGLGGAADATVTRNKNSRGNGDGKVELDELVHYVRREVGDLTDNAQHVQD